MQVLPQQWLRRRPSRWVEWCHRRCSRRFRGMVRKRGGERTTINNILFCVQQKPCRYKIDLSSVHGYKTELTLISCLYLIVSSLFSLSLFLRLKQIMKTMIPSFIPHSQDMQRRPFHPHPLYSPPLPLHLAEQRWVFLVLEVKFSCHLPHRPLRLLSPARQ